MRIPPATLRSTLAVCVATAGLLACSRHSDADDASPSAGVSMMRANAAANDTLRAGDVRIDAIGGGVDLALIGDTISTGLSRQALAKARAETDTAKVTGSGFGASIEKMVKGSVAGALGTRMAFPLSEVRDARYENGAIRFDWAGKPLTIFDHTKVNNRPFLESFTPEDARRFVDAVNARKGARGAAGAF